jgi:hypothetical protein
MDLLRKIPPTSLTSDIEWDEVVVGVAHTLSNYMADTGQMVHDYQMKIQNAGGAEELIQRCWGGIGGVGGAPARLASGSVVAGMSMGMGVGGMVSSPPSPFHQNPHQHSPHSTPMSPHGGMRSPMMSPHGMGAVRMKERLLEQCCAALCNLSCENDLLRIKLGELGACELFISVVRLCDMHRASQVCR